ncbi:MAG: hypothetical protein MI923_02685 [Phycisphaerales bacterium]|nr:hypothetical protein [Phycisphaerales bacterium]
MSDSPGPLIPDPFSSKKTTSFFARFAPIPRVFLKAAFLRQQGLSTAAGLHGSDSGLVRRE